MENQKENILVATETEPNIGTIRIADDVVAMIASIAASDVEGVASMGGDEIMSFVGGKKGKGVKVDIKENIVRIDLTVMLKYGYNIPATSNSIQTKVKTSVENMTGLTCSDVNIRIAGIEM